MKKEISKELISIINGNYPFSITKLAAVPSYYGGVHEILTDTNESYIVKSIHSAGVEEFKLVEVFCDYVKENVTDFETQEFLVNEKGTVLTKVTSDLYLYIVKKRHIITKYALEKKEQLFLGNLLRIFHERLKPLASYEYSSSSWMTTFSKNDLQILEAKFDKEDYVSYAYDVSTEMQKVEKFLLHGDCHQGNISFTNPPFIYDLDTLCVGPRIYEIARTVTHWDFRRPKFELLTNLIKGYKILSDYEVELIPKIMISICYKKYCEFTNNKDEKNAEFYRIFAQQLKHHYKS